LTTILKPVFQYLRRAIVLWVGTIFIVGGGAVALTSIGEWRDAQRFERNALVTRATVISTTLERASRESNTSTQYLATYRFIASDGTTVEQTEELPFDDWEPLGEGSQLDVRYLPADPSTARSRARNPWWEMPAIVGFTGLFVVLGAFLARPGARRVLTILRVQLRGVDATATVLEVAPTGDMINRVPQWHVRYEFRDREGRAQTGVSDFLAPHEAAQWRPADRVAIRFDPARPQDSLWLGKLSA
jgi:Protein of unknown function (DUF3592)